MPISKSIAVGETGVSATVWRVRSKKEDYVDSYIRVVLDGYFDSDATQPILSGGRTIVISGDDYVQDMTLEAVEALLVAPTENVSSADFEDAEII